MSYAAIEPSAIAIANRAKSLAFSESVRPCAELTWRAAGFHAPHRRGHGVEARDIGAILRAERAVDSCLASITSL